MFAISSKELEKSYGGELVLNKINLEVDTGQFVTLLGPSGCGKSTLLHIIAGLEDQDSGQLDCQGQPITGPAQNRVMMMQEAALFPWLNVEKNVAFGLKERNIDKEKRLELAHQELKKVGLADVKKAYPHQLSGGMQQRVALARSMVLKPDILLMDEPFSALDEQTRFKLQQELVNLWQDTDMTIIFVTHSIREALLISERVLVMASNPGQIKAEYELDLPYPRKPNQQKIVNLEAEILEDLLSEDDQKQKALIEKVAG